MYNLILTTPYQTPFTIITNCPQLHHQLKLKHGRYLCEAGKHSNHVITAIKQHDIFNICYCPNKPVPPNRKDEVTETVGNIAESPNDSDPNPGDLIGRQFQVQYPLQAIEDLMYHQRQYEPHIFAIHGGAVEYKKRAYLFIAATTSGKTTLTAYLTANGFGYLTDDCILLDQNSFMIYPFTTPIHLRDGGYQVLKAANALPKQIQLLDDISFRRYVYTPYNCVEEPLPLGKIFFIRRTESVNCLESMSTTEKMTALMKSPIREYKLDRNYLQFLARLTKVPCFRLNYCNMDYVKEVITSEQ